MSKKAFLIALFGIIFLGIVLHLWLIRGNFFHFTVDQGRDAVAVRDFLSGYKLILKGTPTSIAGVYAGPLWYYFLSLGYGLFGGHPIGGVVVVLLFNTLGLWFLTKYLGSRIGYARSLFLALALSLYWPFFQVSLWAFNPFPLVFLSVLELVFLAKFLSNDKRYYFYALLVSLLAFNTEVAGAFSLFVFCLIIGFWGVRKKYLTFKLYFLSSWFLPFLLLLGFFKQLFSQFLKSGSFYSGQTSGLGTFAKMNFSLLFAEILKMYAKSTFPQIPIAGLIIFLLVIYAFFKIKKKDKFIQNFVYLTLILSGVCFCFFGSNNGWRDWQTVFLPIVIFIAFFLMLFSLPKKIATPLLILVFFSQVFFLKGKIIGYLNSKDDPSMLSNQLKVMDWIYTHNENDGFNAYTYTDTYFDYTYQYLFWWYGRSKYRFVPCEYSNFSLSKKELYVPFYLKYAYPVLGCDKFRFLIIESATNGQSNKDWIVKFQKETELLDFTQIGKVRVEKRAVIKLTP